MVRIQLVFDAYAALRCALSGFPSRGVTFGKRYAVVFDSHAIYFRALNYLWWRQFQTLTHALQSSRVQNNARSVVCDVHLRQKIVQ